MTKEDRDKDIEDYLYYLESLCDEISAEYDLNSLHLLGFSQGGATACRWLASTTKVIASLTLYASIFPNDFDFEGSAEKLGNIPSFIAFGDSDQFAGEQVIQEKMQWLQQKGVDASLIRFSGGHELLDSVLEEIAAAWEQAN